MNRPLAQRLAPILFIAALLALWEGVVRLNHVPSFILPTPSQIAIRLVEDWPILWPALVYTCGVTAAALIASGVLGLMLAMLMSASAWVERMIYPLAVVLQVTPIVAIAPLIIIWVHDTRLSLLICAFLVAFFPVVANATTGLNSVDGNLRALFTLYGARPWQRLFWLSLPSALPYYLAGLRISGGLALIGAVVAEFVAGTGGTRSGLAFVIVESGYRLSMDRMFAALFLISASGILLYALISRITRALLRHWHESAL
ncbi:MAG TPA: ABC transporter permease [Novosphingobium sp.]|nr:ABC transporter permease [Novosphingobium sp.]